MHITVLEILVGTSF